MPLPGAADTEFEAARPPGKDAVVPVPHPPTFRLRAVEPARLRERPVREVAEGLGISVRQGEGGRGAW